MTTNADRYRTRLVQRIFVLLCLAALACFLGIVLSSCANVARLSEPGVPGSMTPATGCKIEKLTEPEEVRLRKPRAFTRTDVSLNPKKNDDDREREF